LKVLHTITEFRKWRHTVPGAIRTPFAPTMGALHEGHASLVREARKLAGASGKVLSSIFVNPTQFGPGEDFGKYPRTLEADVALLAEAGCDAVFVPTAQEMYPDQQEAGTSVEAGGLANVLEGAIRPGHFRGVCTVVAKLLNIVTPTDLLLGQKDFQQQAVLRQMVRDLNMAVNVVTCPTIREADGLAMSSRNRYLNANERARAVGLFLALQEAEGAYDGGERKASVLEAGMRRQLESRGVEVQYAVAAEPRTLRLWKEGEGRIEGEVVFLIAGKVGGTRLIDNWVVGP
jgi:pantoate--beta-alanine ligase